MSAVYGLPLIGVLLIVLVLVRDAARKERLRRGNRSRKGGRFYWEAPSRPARSEMRETSDQTTVMDSIKSSQSDKGSR